MKKPGLCILCVSASLFAGPGHAEEQKPWSDEAELSYLTTSGNTEVETLAVKNTFKYHFSDISSVIWKLAGLKTTTDGELSAERYATDLRAQQNFTRRAYFYENIGWLQDDFLGIHKRVYAGLGPGYKFLTGPTHTLLGELGLAYVEETYTDSDKTADFTEGRAFVEYQFAFNKKNRFSQSFEYLYDFDVTENKRYNSETAIIAALNDSMSLKASYTVYYDNLPTPATLKKRDDITSIAIIVNY